MHTSSPRADRKSVKRTINKMYNNLGFLSENEDLKFGNTGDMSNFPVKIRTRIFQVANGTKSPQLTSVRISFMYPIGARCRSGSIQKPLT
jgi:hypothetical protein